MTGGRGAAGGARSNTLSGFLGEHSVLCFAQMYRDKGGGRRELNGEMVLGAERFPPACISESHFHYQRVALKGFDSNPSLHKELAECLVTSRALVKYIFSSKAGKQVPLLPCDLLSREKHKHSHAALLSTCSIPALCKCFSRHHIHLVEGKQELEQPWQQPCWPSKTDPLDLQQWGKSSSRKAFASFAGLQPPARLVAWWRSLFSISTMILSPTDHGFLHPCIPTAAMHVKLWWSTVPSGISQGSVNESLSFSAHCSFPSWAFQGLALYPLLIWVLPPQELLALTLSQKPSDQHPRELGYSEREGNVIVIISIYLLAFISTSASSLH